MHSFSEEESVGSNSKISTCYTSCSCSCSCNLFQPVKVGKRNLQPKNPPQIASMAEVPGAEENNAYDASMKLLQCCQLNVNLNEPNTKQIVQAAAKYAKSAPRRPQNTLFDYHDCQIIRDTYKIKVDLDQIYWKLKMLYHRFKAYCSDMKMGKSGLRFDYNSGEVRMNPYLSLGEDPRVTVFNYIEEKKIVLQYFKYLKEIYYFVWERFQPKSVFSGSKRKSFSSGNMLSSSSKKRTFSSVNEGDIFDAVVQRVKKLLGLNKNDKLATDYLLVLGDFYANKQHSCKIFMELDDETALNELQFHVKESRKKRNQ